MSAIEEASGVLGGVTRVAAAIGVTAPAVHQWLRAQRSIPPDRCPAIERATTGRVSCEQLRPDVRWQRVPDPDWPHPCGRPCIDVAAPPVPQPGEQQEARDAA